MKQVAVQIDDPAQSALSTLVRELVRIASERPDLTVNTNTIAPGNVPVDREHGAHFDHEPAVETGRGSATLSVTARRAKLTAHWRGEDGTVGNLEERLLLDLASSPRCGRRGYQAMDVLAEALVVRLRKRLEDLRSG